MIDFKSYDEQIAILQSRNLIIADTDKAKNFLTRHNYYNVINAYKDAFLDKNSTTEAFVKGATFDDIHHLYNFDKALRLIFSDYLIDIERTFKSVIAYEFTKAHSNHDLDYTNINNFDIQNWAIDASRLTTKLYKDIFVEQQRGNDMINHYIRNYHRVPLWVFVNCMSFGTISIFFKCMKVSDKISVAKNLSAIFNRHMIYRDIENAIKICVLLRNYAAHDQRVFDFSSKVLTVSQNHPLLKQYSITRPLNNLFGAICCIYDFTDEEQFNNLKYHLNSCATSILSKINSVNPEKIMDMMGIPLSFFKK